MANRSYDQKLTEGIRNELKRRGLAIMPVDTNLEEALGKISNLQAEVEQLRQELAESQRLAKLYGISVMEGLSAYDRLRKRCEALEAALRSRKSA